MPASAEDLRPSIMDEPASLESRAAFKRLLRVDGVRLVMDLLRAGVSVRASSTERRSLHVGIRPGNGGIRFGLRF